MGSMNMAMRTAATLSCLLAFSAFAALAAEPAATCPDPCYVVADYWPYKQCKASCDQEVCGRGYQVYQSKELCCTPGLAFPEGCTERPKECWVVEDNAARTCRRDDRKCLQGYGVFPSEATCCTPGAAFQEGCLPVTPSETECFVVDTYYPARTCRPSRTLCALQDKGVQSWTTKEACCGPNGAFGQQGCSTYTPITPCWTIDTYYPERRCTETDDVATCNRGWGAYSTQAVCCTPGAAFNEGCSSRPAAAATATKVAAAARSMGDELPSELAATTPKPRASSGMYAPAPEAEGKHSSSSSSRRAKLLAPAPELAEAHARRSSAARAVLG